MRRRVLLAFEQAEREPDRAAQRRLLTFVVVGGGPTGVELAGALAEISRHALANDFRAIDPESARIILVEGGPDVLPTYPEPLSAFARRALEKLGVVGLDGKSGERRRSGQGARRRRSDRGGHDSVGGGRLGVAARRNARRARRSVGRVARQRGPDVSRASGGVRRRRPRRVRTAGGPLAARRGAGGDQQAAHAASNIARLVAGSRTQPFAYRNLGNMATIGRNSAVADFPRFRLKGYLAWLIWLFVHIFKLIGFRNRLSVMTQWAFSYMTYQRSVRLITGDDAWTSRQHS